MKRLLALLVLTVVAALVFWAATASASSTTATLDCTGLTLMYSGFPTTAVEVDESWRYNQGGTFNVVDHTTGASGTVHAALPTVPPDGTLVTVVVNFATPGGSTQLTEAVTMECFAAPPSPPTTTTTSTQTTTVTTSAPATTPVPQAKPVRPAPPRHCGKIKRSRLHASIRPQALTRGLATLRISAPPSIRRVHIEIHSDKGRTTWTKTRWRRHVKFRLNVTDPRIWGRLHQCGCTYGNHRIVIEFIARCSSAKRRLVYNDQSYQGYRKFH